MERRSLPEREMAVRFGPYPLRGSQVAEGGELKTRYVGIRGFESLPRNRTLQDDSMY
jgi:hypothetical protein